MPGEVPGVVCSVDKQGLLSWGGRAQGMSVSLTYLGLTVHHDEIGR